MIRRIRQWWLELFGRRFVVAYDPADVQWYVDWHNEKPTVYTGEQAKQFGADENGEFRSRRQAEKFLGYLKRQAYYMVDPIYPTHIIRVR